MSFPQISAMYKWVNSMFPGAQGGTQDFLQLIRASDGQILGWIDSEGFLQGSLAASVPVEDADCVSVWLEDDFVSFSGTGSALGTVGSLNWIPNGILGVVSLESYAAPNFGVIASGESSQNTGMTLSPSSLVGGYCGFPLTFNTGWEATFIFNVGALGSASQHSRLYLGFGVDGTENDNFAYGRPSKFIGLRFDTDPGNPQFTLSAAANASNGLTEYTGTFPTGSGNGFYGQTIVISGFSNPDNNGTFVCTLDGTGLASSATKIVVNNPNGAAVSAAGTATIPTPAISDTTYHFECVQNVFWNSNVQGAVANSGIAPDNNWHRFTMRSIVLGEILFSIDGGTEQMLSMSTDSCSGAGLAILNEETYAYLVCPAVTAGCAGTPIVISGSAHSGNNGTWNCVGNFAAAIPSPTFEGGNANLKFIWYNAFAPVIISGADSTGYGGGVSVDYFSFVYNPRLALDFNQTANPSLPRFFNGQV